MRTPLLPGMSSSRRPLTARALAVGMLALGLAAWGVTPASAAGPAAATRSGDGHVGAHWDGGSARSGGVEYSWAPRTYDYEADACPRLDSGTQTARGAHETLVIQADPGKVISAYCVTAGSRRTGEGPKLVELDEPVARLTIAYPAGGRCQSIAHYSYAQQDAPRADTPGAPGGGAAPVTPATPRSGGSDEDAPTAGGTSPSPSGEGQAPQADAPTPDAQPDDVAPLSADAEAADAGTDAAPKASGDAGSLTADEAVAVANVTQAGDVSTAPVDEAATAAEATSTATAPTPADAAPVVRAGAERLALTGGAVATAAVVAVALVALGVLAVLVARRRRGAQI
ncbi:hypothetical protein [Xylanimonas ulmi]|uniref:Uncharacterized protein n=1 Tax=Xylanimonas ulmi TaxID=228973 RepID=A0A4Q7M1T1_9MICO|nr:hypothetical protein [Xylanibacterium ulmi]RZS59869.1 hypothetical protein EV386_0105 [Xylanibacterium ulmi]